MNPFVMQYRKLKCHLKYLASYVDLDPRGNQVVRRTDFKHCQKPVLLLHGFFSTRRVLEVLEHRLRREGYCVWSIHLGGTMDRFNTHRIDELAQKVRGKVDRLYERHPGMGPLTIIGHSKGGLIGTYYVKRLGGDARVKNLITLGTPHRGTRMAYLGCATLGWFSRSMWQLTPTSRFIKDLGMGAFPRHVRLTSIYSRDDVIARYPSSVLDVDGQPNVSNVELSGVVPHGELLTRRAVWEVIQRELALGYADTPTPVVHAPELPSPPLPVALTAAASP
ncbi:alpha/beta fold hydrolase [Corallococcus macrosporus]|uniref:Alpha/beta fold hydrolase n=1 Tax=Corallococcus macrosporus TaxID=35 RepID=A0ABS3D413_9BACT|nr:alpha/beta fold hydrolase [Corallococcus macrosporus]MBN8226369.1 alpha/beta fold hydrolase [Corallococcus macrosporus]